MKQTLSFSMFLGALTMGFLACGGKVVIDAPQAAGAGGVGGTGQGGSGLSTSNTSVSVSASASATGSSSGQPSPCDLQNDCGACVNCAVGLVCPEEWAKCQAVPACEKLVYCLPSCLNNEPCIKKCLDAYPDGVDLYNQTAQCVVCQACSVDCGTLATGCL